MALEQRQASLKGRSTCTVRTLRKDDPDVSQGAGRTKEIDVIYRPSQEIQPGNTTDERRSNVGSTLPSRSMTE